MDSLSITAMIETSRTAIAELPDRPTGKNSMYGMLDTAVGAFGGYASPASPFLARALQAPQLYAALRYKRLSNPAQWGKIESTLWNCCGSV